MIQRKCIKYFDHVSDPKDPKSAQTRAWSALPLGWPTRKISSRTITLWPRSPKTPSTRYGPIGYQNVLLFDLQCLYEFHFRLKPVGRTPRLEEKQLEVHDIKYAGVSWKEKIDQLRWELGNASFNCFILTADASVRGCGI